MVYLRIVVVLLFVSLLAAGALTLRSAVGVALGYSAKQLCSGVFISGLPAEFTERLDILPRMAILGPALDSLVLEADEVAGTAEARLFGASARAVHSADQGCVLHASCEHWR